MKAIRLRKVSERRFARTHVDTSVGIKHEGLPYHHFTLISCPCSVIVAFSRNSNTNTNSVNDFSSAPSVTAAPISSIITTQKTTNKHNNHFVLFTQGLAELFTGWTVGVFYIVILIICNAPDDENVSAINYARFGTQLNRIILKYQHMKHMSESCNYLERWNIAKYVAWCTFCGFERFSVIFSIVFFFFSFSVILFPMGSFQVQ